MFNTIIFNVYSHIIVILVVWWGYDATGLGWLSEYMVKVIGTKTPTQTPNVDYYYYMPPDNVSKIKFSKHSYYIVDTMPNMSWCVWCDTYHNNFAFFSSAPPFYFNKIVMKFHIQQEQCKNHFALTPLLYYCHTSFIPPPKHMQHQHNVYYSSNALHMIYISVAFWVASVQFCSIFWAFHLAYNFLATMCWHRIQSNCVDPWLFCAISTVFRWHLFPHRALCYNELKFKVRCCLCHFDKLHP